MLLIKAQTYRPLETTSSAPSYEKFHRRKKNPSKANWASDNAAVCVDCLKWNGLIEQIINWCWKGHNENQRKSGYVCNNSQLMEKPNKC